MHSLIQLEEQCLRHHEALGHSPKTSYHYFETFKILHRFLEEREYPLDTSCLTTARMQEFSRWLRDTPTRGFRGSTERSVHGIYGIMKDLRAFVHWINEETDLSLTVKVPIPKLPQTLFPILSESDLQRIFSCKLVASNSELAKRNRALISFMLDTGVRLSEVANLLPSDLQLKEGQAKVRGKGNKERMVFFSDGVTEALSTWMAIRGNGEEAVFWLKPAGIRMVMERVRAQVGLPMLTAHQIRHTASTMLVRKHADIHTVKRILGHAQLSTVELYLSLDNEDLKRKHEAASPFEQIRSTMEPEKRRRRLKAS